MSAISPLDIYPREIKTYIHKTQPPFLFFKFIYLIYLFLAVLGLPCCSRAFSTCGERGLLFVAVHGLIMVASLVAELRLQVCGLQWSWRVSSVVVAHGLRAQAQWLWRTGLVAQWHVGSSRTRARTHVPCTGRWILNHCTTKEAPASFHD